MNEELDDIKITRYCTFEDKDLENDYIKTDIGRSMRYIMPLILFFGILNLGFSIPDYLFLDQGAAFIIVLTGRILFLLLIIISLIIFNKTKDSNVFINWISVYGVIYIALFLMAFYLYSSPDFMIQAFGVTLVTSALFMIPNKWINNVMTCTVFDVLFIIIANIKIKNIKPEDFWSGFVYIILFLIMSAISSNFMNRYKRVRYLNNIRLERTSVIDSLTGLFNKRKFEEELKKWVSYSRRFNEPVTLAIFDFDDFKSINDTYGHILGDDVIRQTSEIMKKNIRNTDILARWGGEEFTLLMPGTDITQAKVFVERLRSSIADSETKGIRTTCSFGIAQMNEDDDETKLLNRADMLLYKAKNSGKDMVQF